MRVIEVLRDFFKGLLGAQQADGSWGSIDDTCAAIRFLDAWRVRQPNR